MFGALPQNSVFFPTVATSSINQLVTPTTTSATLIVASIPSVPNTAIPLIVPPPPPSYAEAIAQHHQNTLLTALAAAKSPDLNELSLQDHDEELDDDQVRWRKNGTNVPVQFQPLDLSLKRPMSNLCEPGTSACCRPSVIRGSLCRFHMFLV